MDRYKQKNHGKHPSLFTALFNSFQIITMLGNPQFSLLLSHSTTSDFAYWFFLLSGSLNGLFKDGFHIHSNFSFLLENNSEKKKKVKERRLN